LEYVAGKAGGYPKELVRVVRTAEAFHNTIKYGFVSKLKGSTVGSSSKFS
jgi:hypothetical protein